MMHKGWHNFLDMLRNQKHVDALLIKMTSYISHTKNVKKGGLSS